MSAADPAAGLQLFSPPASGRSSPAPRATRNAVDDSLSKRDKGYRRYAAGLERALALWDTAQQEWADYISFLARLLKALHAHPSEATVIPHSDTVALRLAQCLNPTLPSGVHQKALEVYSYIFTTIGKDALARDLGVYFPGLASVLSFASLSVRPLFLSVFEENILKIDASALRPALKAIILSILPGLEDETSEDFERMVSALDKLRKVIETGSQELTSGKGSSGSSHFWQCFFLAAITNASRRQGALAFLVRRLPKFAASKPRHSISSPATASKECLSPEAEAAISPEPGLLIRCFESGLSDPQLLIQRGFLDLLVTHLPLDSPVLQERVDKGDLERLVAAAAGVVSRRDMSLNRRLWAWFLGPDPTTAEGNGTPTSPNLDNEGDHVDPAAQHAAFFSRYGFEALTSSVLKLIDHPSQIPAERARPFRICLSLMDRWEVGGLIVPEIFLPALRSMQAYGEASSRDQFEEVLRSASAFFDGVDAGLIWAKLIYLVKSSLDPNKINREQATSNIKLVRFVLARFNLKEEDMLLHHMPLLVVSTLASLNQVCVKTEVSTVPEEVVEMAFEIVDSLVQIMPERAVRADPSTEPTKTEVVIAPRGKVFERINQFYDESQGTIETTEQPFTSSEIGQYILRESVSLFATCLQSGGLPCSPTTSARVLGNIITKTRHFAALDHADPFEIFQAVLASHVGNGDYLSFSQLGSIVTVLAALQASIPGSPYVATSQLPDIVHPLVTALWYYLSPVRPKYHVEATRCLLQLHSISPAARIVEAALSSIIVERSTQKSNSDSGQHFAVLWTHTMHELNTQAEKRANGSRRANGQSLRSFMLVAGDYAKILSRPLLLLLDTLVEDGCETAAFMRTWLQDLPSLSRVLNIVVSHIQSLECVEYTANLLSDDPQATRSDTRHDDSKDCLYYLKHLFSVLKRPSHLTWATFAETTVPQPDESLAPVKLQEWLVRTCLVTSSLHDSKSNTEEGLHLSELHRVSISIISQIYQSPFVPPLRDLELEVPLMARLRSASPCLQNLLLGAILSALRLRHSGQPEEKSIEARPPANPTHRSRLSLVINRDSEDTEIPPILPPPQLVEILKYGFTSPTSRLVLDDWVQFLVEVLPMFADTIFQSLLPLVECFCKQIMSNFDELKITFGRRKIQDVSPEASLISLINGLEQILAKAHDRLTLQETKASAHKSPEQPQGFFSNVVSGVFTAEATQTRAPTANSRLSVLLCFQDTVRICFGIWSWAAYEPGQSQQDPGSAASFGYTSLRMRNRARRLLEHLFAAEALECLETLVELWSKSTRDDNNGKVIMGLLNVLNGSKPKHTIPAIFNAVYSRTDPNALDPSRMSTLTSNLTESELVAFLVEYTRSLEDDAMDEIWADCTLFLRDVLANPLPHRQILPTLLEFTAVIGQKVDNTTFGEQRKMRRELADIFARILTAIFTTRSMGYKQDTQQHQTLEKNGATTNGSQAQKRATDVVAILTSITPNLPTILVDNDRIAKVVSDITTSVVGPNFRAKSFPENVTESQLCLVQGLIGIAQSNKLLKKDIYDAFNDPKFFNTSVDLLRNLWLPILSQWTQSDKERLPEILARITAPTTAGIMFGVGAASARQEADRKTQLNLRRISLLILASPEDAYTPNIPQIVEKAVELFGASPATSPSSATRADVLNLLRAIVLKTSPIHLASFWPIANGELTSALLSLLPDAVNKEHYNNAGIIQACKLLDELVVLAPDDFQLSEWLFICDTIDAVYKPDTKPTTLSTHLSLTDEINEVLSQTSAAPAPPQFQDAHLDQEGKRTLFLDPLIEALEEEEGAPVMEMARGELVNRLVRPFLGSLALNAFEARYGGGKADWEGVWQSVVKDAVG